MALANALVIDDNPVNITVLTQLLQIEDVMTTTLSSTRNLLEDLAMLSDIHLIFLDLEMPDYNGYEALEIIRQQPNLADVLVVAYSVHISELNTALSKGFNGFLGKPLSAEAFPDQLRRILAGETVTYTP